MRLDILREKWYDENRDRLLEKFAEIHSDEKHYGDEEMLEAEAHDWRYGEFLDKEFESWIKPSLNLIKNQKH